eukprot:1068684-Pelagomonas_calceolata.AAC.8
MGGRWHGFKPHCRATSGAAGHADAASPHRNAGTECCHVPESEWAPSGCCAFHLFHHQGRSLSAAVSATPAYPSAALFVVVVSFSSKSWHQAMREWT